MNAFIFLTNTIFIIYKLNIMFKKMILVDGNRYNEVIDKFKFKYVFFYKKITKNKDSWLLYNLF